MATTLHILKTYYSNVLRVDYGAIPAADATMLANLAASVDANTTSLAAAQTTVARMALATTSVATMAYQFFAGLTPFSHGLDYLISPQGPNPNNLNSAYYQNFNVVNRYINFAVNLGRGGEGAAAFDAAYGALSLVDTFNKAYLQIFGFAPTTGKASLLLNEQVSNGLGGTYSRAEYLAAAARDSLEGIGTKAAIVGWLLGAAATENLGTYAEVANAFLADVGPDGLARFHSDMVLEYGPAQPAGPVGATISFNPGQSVSPTASDPALKSTGANDTITGTAGLNAGQSVQAGAGHDVITVPGTTFGRIEAGDGNDTLTLGGLGATTGTLGVPAQFGTVTLGAGRDTVYLNGPMAAGTSITADGVGDTIYLKGTVDGNATVSGFQTVYIQSTGVSTLPVGAETIYINVPGDGGGFAAGGSTAGALVIAKDTAVPISVGFGAAKAGELYLDNYMGAPTTSVSAFFGGYSANGGAITIASTVDTFTLHVARDSTAGMIAYHPGKSVYYDVAISPQLVIDGAGALTAQISPGFTNIDASAAGDLTLNYTAPTQAENGQRSGVFRLSDNKVVLNVELLGFNAPYGEAVAMNYVFGAGVNDFNVLNTFSNLAISGELVSAPSRIEKFQKGVDHINLDQVIDVMTPGAQALVTGATSLTAALIQLSAGVAPGLGAVFEFGGDTYIYRQDEQVGVTEAGANGGDGLIRLVGVTGLSVGSGAGAADIHYG